MARLPAFVFALALACLVGCEASKHPVETARFGTPSSSDSLIAALAQPGPFRLTKVVAADWNVDLSGLLNLDHPAAREAGLVDRREPVQIYFYVLEHEKHGTFLVDSGLEARFADGGVSPHLGSIVRWAMSFDEMRVHTTTARWLAEHDANVSAVLLTHLHVDHILGIPDFKAPTPVYVGPFETTARQLTHMFSQTTTDGLLSSLAELQQWDFHGDEAGRFDGVLDLLGDGSLWALHVPGHTPGSTAYVVRTVDGPHLILGDACHTAWGWLHGVEPGTFSDDQPRSAVSLQKLRELASAVPNLQVHPGHQGL